MALEELPKRLFQAGFEPEVNQINQCCKWGLLDKLKKALPDEFKEVSADPLFKNIIALYRNNVVFSARIMHSMMCRQLCTQKLHEIWCVFGGRPLRFSLQEFHAITGLKVADDFDKTMLEKWTDNNGFWSKLLKKRKCQISIHKITRKYLVVSKSWEEEDRLRLVYICVIAGVIMARDYKKDIPVEYIKLVMNKEALKTYPWGLHAFDLLMKSIFNTKTKLTKPKSYVLEGLSYAFQIWVMEAIPVVKKLMGEKIKQKHEGARYSNWVKVMRIGYDEFTQLEKTLKDSDEVFPYITLTGDNDMVSSNEYLRCDDRQDVEVTNIMKYITDGIRFGDVIWETVEAEFDGESLDEDDDDVNMEEEVDDVVLDEDVGDVNLEEEVDDVATNCGNDKSGLRKKRKRKNADGAEKRKKKILWERAEAKPDRSVEEMKSFVQDFFLSNFTAFTTDIGGRMQKMETSISEIKTSVSHIRTLVSGPTFANNEDVATTSNQTKKVDKSQLKKKKSEPEKNETEAKKGITPPRSERVSKHA